MAILAFQKPDKVVMLEADNQFGKFEFRPLEPGFGVTIGNALRRILLSSLEGYAVNTIRIAGVEHEFSSVPGVKEDVTNIILNLKQVRFKQVVEEFENEKVSITVENSTEFKAGDIGKYLTGFEVLNPDLVICHLDAKASMQIDLTINKGRGYVPADENRQFCTDVNVLPIDSIYTPIRNVKYAVEPYRVEQKTDYDKLVLEVTTDGSISPKDALKEAAKILIYHFMLFSDEKITLESPDQENNQEFDEEVLHMRQLLKTRLVDMNLSVRALNCLKAADVETLGDLVQYNKTDLLKFRNFGKKSLSELDDLLESLNLSFGTDISKYKLDKDAWGILCPKRTKIKMRHNKKFNHLGRTASHRNAMLANMASSLILSEHKRITTTLAKAKALKKYVEPLITRSKNDTTTSRRVVFRYLQNKYAVKALFGEVAEKVANRPGGYTRVIKLGTRQGDAAEIAFIELVDFDENMAKTPKAAKKTRRSRKATKAEEAPATEAPATEEAAAE